MKKYVYMKKYLVILMLFISVTCWSQTIYHTIEFSVGTSKIIHNDNYRVFMEDIMPFLKNNIIEAVYLIGCASPEGNKNLNIKLANNRSNVIKSYIEDFVPKQKIHIKNDYQLFLQKTGYDERDWNKLRATYIEIHVKNIPEVITQIDTVYIKEIDTIYCKQIDTIYIKPERIPILAVKTNLLSDVLITPNIQAELYTWLWGLSIEFDYTFPWYHKDRDTYFYYQLLNGTVGIRKYLNNKYNGHWIGIYGNTAIYDICPWNKNKGWQGEVHGAGIGYGYVFQNKKHPRWKFELYGRAGWFNTKFDTYHASEPWDEKYYYDWYLRASDFVPRRFKMNYFGPTEIGFNLTFDLICARKY